MAIEAKRAHPHPRICPRAGRRTFPSETREGTNVAQRRRGGCSWWWGRGEGKGARVRSKRRRNTHLNDALSASSQHTPTNASKKPIMCTECIERVRTRSPPRGHPCVTPCELFAFPCRRSRKRGVDYQMYHRKNRSSAIPPYTSHASALFRRTICRIVTFDTPRVSSILASLLPTPPSRRP